MRQRAESRGTVSASRPRGRGCSHRPPLQAGAPCAASGLRSPYTQHPPLTHPPLMNGLCSTTPPRSGSCAASWHVGPEPTACMQHSVCMCGGEAHGERHEPMCGGEEAAHGVRHEPSPGKKSPGGQQGRRALPPDWPYSTTSAGCLPSWSRSRPLITAARSARAWDTEGLPLLQPYLVGQPGSSGAADRGVAAEPAKHSDGGHPPAHTTE